MGLFWFHLIATEIIQADTLTEANTQAKKTASENGWKVDGIKEKVKADV
jgi:hypothetical protein